MKAYRALLVVSLLFLVGTFASLARPATGRIEGRVTLSNGSALAGVGVTIDGIPASALTNSDGRFFFSRVPEGTHSLTFTFLGNTATRSDVVVDAGSTTAVDQSVQWEIGIVENVTVTAVSRQPERIVDAPGAVTSVSAKEIERQASHGSIPKLFEFTPGVDITQINLAEFLVETRGFNSNLNRRVAVLADGRDLTDPFIGAMEWPAVSYPLDDLADLELVRGPSSALYGANATGGVVSLTTKAPRDSQGGQIRLAAGELNSANLDFRWAGKLGSEWYAKVYAGRRESEGYSVSRLTTTEYSNPCSMPGQTDCLPLDGIPLPEDEIKIDLGGLRFDKYLPNGSVFTLEGGTSEHAGTIFINATGRGQLTDVKRPWARFNFSAEHLNVLAYYSERDAEAVNLNFGSPFLLDADVSKVEAQTNWHFADNKVRLVAGASYNEENVDSNVLAEEITVNESALFAQVDWSVNDRLKLVGAARWDDSDLHDSQVSPKAAVLYSINPQHTLRLTYNEAFQVPTYGELFLFFPFPPTDLSSLNQICVDNAGVDCGLDSTPTFALGNESLDVEQTKTVELGYKGILGRKAFLTVDLYDSTNEDFVAGLLPQVGTPLAQINDAYGPWQGPTEAETIQIAPVDCPVANFAPGQTVADCVREAAEAQLPLSQLTNLEDSSIVLALSYTTFGRVDTQGAEIGLGYFFTDDLRLSFSYSRFEFDLKKTDPLVESVLVPNAPENRASLGLSYAAERWDANIRGRWVDEFRWVNAAYQGDVESFVTVDLSGNYRFNSHWLVGANIANLLDEEHWEAFGGDLLARRALLHATFYW